MAKSDPLDLDALLADNRRQRPGTGCTIGVALAQLPAPTATKVRAALADKDGYSATGLVAILRALGYKASRSPIERHRRGDCACNP